MWLDYAICHELRGQAGPTSQTYLDGRNLATDDGRARRVSDEVVDQGLRRPLLDNAAGNVAWLNTRKPVRQGGPLISPAWLQPWVVLLGQSMHG